MAPISTPPPHIPITHVYPFEEPVYDPLVRRADAIAVATAELVTLIPLGSFEPYNRRNV